MLLLFRDHCKNTSILLVTILNMGLLCSKSSTLSGGDTVLGSVAPEQTKVPRPRPRVAAPAATDRRRKQGEGVVKIHLLRDL
jgi:hypothetical protein